MTLLGTTTNSTTHGAPHDFKIPVPTAELGMDQCHVIIKGPR